MEAQYQSKYQLRRKRIREAIISDFKAMTSDGSAKMVVYDVLADKYEISQSCIRAYLKQEKESNGVM